MRTSEPGGDIAPPVPEREGTLDPPVPAPLPTPGSETARARSRGPMAVVAALLIAGAVGAGSWVMSNQERGGGDPSASGPRTTRVVTGTTRGGGTIAGPGAAGDSEATTSTVAHSGSSGGSTATSTTPGGSGGDGTTTAPLDPAYFPGVLAELIEPEVDDSALGSLDPGSGTGFGLTVDHNASYQKDSDYDGLSDGLETDLANWFKPVLVMDEEEHLCTRPEEDLAAAYQVSPKPGGAIVTFVVLYPRDCGDPAFGLYSHAGDSEASWIHVARSSSGWSLQGIEINRHYGHPTYYEFDHTGVYGGNTFAGLECWTESGPHNPCWGTISGDQSRHPILYVSESKHAAYIAVAECEWADTEIPESDVKEALQFGGYFEWVDFLGDSTLHMEDCGGGEPILLDTPFEANVGEKDGSDGLGGTLRRQAFDLFGESDAPRLVRLFGRELAWSAEHFCGNEFGSACAGGVGGKWKTGVAVDFSIERPSAPGGSGDGGAGEDTSATVHDVWLEYDVTSQSGEVGIVVHTAFSVSNQYQALDVRVVAAVWRETGQLVLSGADPALHTDAGQLAVARSATTNSGVAEWGQSDFELLLPYDQFYPGRQTYYVDIIIETPDGQALDGSSSRISPTFDVTRTNALSGDWQYSVNGDCCYTMTLSQNSLDPNEYSFVDAAGSSGRITLDGYDITVTTSTGGFISTARVTFIDGAGNPTTIEWSNGVVMER